MKVVTSVLLVSLLAVLGSAQDSNSYSNWVSFETPGNVISVSMPKDYLVNIEKIQDEDKKIIYSFANGVMMEFSYYRVQDAKSNLAKIRAEAAKNPVTMDFAVGKLAGKQIVYSDDGYRYTLYIASSDMYYFFEVSAATKDQKEIALFLQSIKVNGKQLVKSDKNLDGPSAPETIFTKSLKPSERVTDALKRKLDKFTGKITYEPLTAFKDCKQDFDRRSAILLTEIKPDFSAFSSDAKGGEVKIRLMLLADGQVADIVVYSDADRRILKSYAESARKAKFIPAESNGSPTDACKVVWSSLRKFETRQVIF